MKNLHIKLSPADIELPIIIKYPINRLYIDKSSIGKNENEQKNYNLFAIARSNENVKNLVVNLANKGFYLVNHKDGISIFEKFINAEQFKHNLINKNIKIFNDLYYTLETPKIKTNKPRLLVVFSSVADFSLNASISRRNFFTNFESIGKYIPQNTYILRISDIGSVVGSFYMNNNFNNQVESNIQLLLEFILLENNISKTDVVLYGTSKGATAALYHGILGHYKAVCVDPIVSNKYHEIKYNDSHFTLDTFSESKQKKFKYLMKNSLIDSDINILYSKNSPIYNDIIEIIKNNDKDEKIKFIHSNHPSIKDHPDVGPNTINILTMIINNLYYQVGITSSKDLDC